ncbi:hypothetical protein HN51_070021, partial [Arachis hypogaea]
SQPPALHFLVPPAFQAIEHHPVTALTALTALTTQLSAPDSRRPSTHSPPSHSRPQLQPSAR